MWTFVKGGVFQKVYESPHGSTELQIPIYNMWSRRSVIERCPSPWNRIRLFLQASEGQWYLWSFVFQSIGFVLTKYHCPSPACKLLLLGIIVFGFTAKGIARSQIDDSTCSFEAKIILFQKNFFRQIYFSPNVRMCQFLSKWV